LLKSKKKRNIRKVNPNIERAKGKDMILTLGPLLILRRAPVPAGHLTLSCGEVGLSLV
jgi:hypothetical protein